MTRRRRSPGGHPPPSALRRRLAALRPGLPTVITCAVILALAFFAHPLGAVAATNDIFTVAGNGTQGSDGDGGPATAAVLNAPIAVAELPDGGFVLADPSSTACGE